MSDRFGASDKDCPLCDADCEEIGPVPVHIRRNCPVAAQIRVFEMEMGPKGFDAEPGNRAETSGMHNHVERDPETGHFVSRGETA